MNNRGFSLVEVMVAAAIIVVGLTAGAVLASTLMVQQELNAASLRAANLQEQAVRLYRMDLAPSVIIALLPEQCSASGSPAPGAYTLSFSRPASTSVTVDGSAVALEQTGSSLVYCSPNQAGIYLTNTVTILRPSTRVKYAQ